MIKLLIVISNTRIGGVEKLVERLLRYIDKTKFEVSVIITHCGGVLTKSYQENSNVMGVGHLGLGKPDTERMKEKIDAIVSMVEARKYDIIHIFNLFDLQNLMYRIENNFNVVQSIHIDLTTGTTSRDMWKNKILAHELHYKCIFIDSLKNKDIFKQSNSVYLRNGIDTNLFKPEKKKEKTITWMGRLTTEKGADRLINIIRGMPDYEFTVISNEDKFMYESFLEASKSLSNLNLKFSLDEKEVANILSTSEYFLFTSREEGMPVSIIEAMSSGCCCVVTDVGAVRDLIQDKKNGYIIPVTDNIEGYVIGNWNKYKTSVGKQARKYALKNHKIEDMVKILEKKYCEICQK